MAGGSNYITSIDIGTDKIAVLIAEKEDNDRLRIIGYNISPSDGVKKGSISAIDPLSRAISKALDQICLLYTSPSPRDQRGSRMPSSA